MITYPITNKIINVKLMNEIFDFVDHKPNPRASFSQGFPNLNTIKTTPHILKDKEKKKRVSLYDLSPKSPKVDPKKISLRKCEDVVLDKSDNKQNCTHNSYKT